MDILSTTPLTLASTKAGMSAGTTSTLTTANTQLYSMLGKAFSKAAVANEATPTTDATTGVAFVPVPVLFGAVYTVCRDSAGALKVSQGPLQALDAGGTKFLYAPQFPALPSTVCPIGYITILVKTGGATHTFGTSNLTGPPANTDINFVDVFTLPSRPQVA